jgi:hypothetical protein
VALFAQSETFQSLTGLGQSTAAQLATALPDDSTNPSDRKLLPHSDRFSKLHQPHVGVGDKRIHQRVEGVLALKVPSLLAEQWARTDVAVSRPPNI